MKKNIIVVPMLVLSILLALIGCEKEKISSGNINESSYKIGIVQLMEHQALDDARTGFVEKLEELGINAEIYYQNAQGDISVARTISEKFVSDGVDLIYAIATPAAEAAASTTTEIPILFSAVTDPVSAHLVESLEKPNGNISGTSDAADVSLQLSIYKELDPKIKKIGIIYSLDEINSLVQVEEAKRVGKELGLEVISSGISNLSDLPQVASSVISSVDGIYLLSDNKIASSISLLTDLMNENKIISICAEESQVAGGALLTNGLRYKDLGAQTGEMAKKVLEDGQDISEIPVEKSKNTIMIVNKNTLKALGISEDLEILKGAEYLGE